MNSSDGGEMLVSVVIPCFNVRPYINAALDSLLAQSYRRWEAIVVDDGSSDGTDACVAAYSDSRIRLIRQGNQGVSMARNRGVDEASGGGLLFLDGDDWLASDALERLVSHLSAKPRAVAVYGAFCFVTEDGSRITRQKSGPFPAGIIIERLLIENLFANGGHLLIKAGAIETLGRFRSDLSFGEDWEYWCRLALSGLIEVVPGASPLLFVRQRSSGAYLRMAADARAFAPCTNAIFNNPQLRERYTPAKLSRLRAGTEAEIDWIVGRELMRHGDPWRGLAELWRSFRRRPSAKRGVLLAVAHSLPVLPGRLSGPFRRYRQN